MTPDEEQDVINNRRIQRLIGFAAAALLAAGTVSLLSSSDVPQKLKELIETRNDLQDPPAADSTIILTKTPD